MKLKVSALTPGSKVTSKRHQEPDADVTVAAIVKVSEPNYVPRHLHLRSRIDPYMITVECRGEVTKLTRSLAFVRGAMTVDGETVMTCSTVLRRWRPR